MASLATQLAGLARAGARRIPAQQPARIHEQAFAAGLVDHMTTAIGFALQPMAAELGARAARNDSMRNHINAARDRLTVAVNAHEVTGAIRAHAVEVSAFQRVQLGRQLTAAVGAEVSLHPGDDALEAFRDAMIAGLESIADKLIADVRNIVMGAAHAGANGPQVIVAIGAKADVAARAAGVVAQRQTRRLMARLNVQRQTALGLESFVWRARPGSRHADRDGQIYRFDKPPAGELPGHTHGCECYAQPVVT